MPGNDKPSSSPIEAAPLPTRQDLLDAVDVLFAEGDRALVIEQLDQYESSVPRRERVQMAALVLSEGSLEKLREFVREANLDYRNVLYWYEYMKPGVALRRAFEGRLAARKRGL